MTTDKKDDGFIVDVNDKDCMVLNVRSVKFIDLKVTKVLDENDERIVIYIAPEFWILSENIKMYIVFISLLSFLIMTV